MPNPTVHPEQAGSFDKYPGYPHADHAELVVPFAEYFPEADGRVNAGIAWCPVCDTEIAPSTPVRVTV